VDKQSGLTTYYFAQRATMQSDTVSPIHSHARPHALYILLNYIHSRYILTKHRKESIMYLSGLTQ